jgi:hypothetical protein
MEKMKANIRKASDWIGEKEENIEIKTIEELKQFQIKCCKSLNITFNKDKEEINIIIVDDYME